MKNIKYNAGDAFVFTYPFIRSTYLEFDEDGVSGHATWKPGVRFENTRNGDTLSLCDGLGFQTVTVVGVFKPGKFPERVFFTRKWTDPDGKEFGKGKLHIKTKASFTTLISGYRHQYEMDARDKK